MVSAGEAMGRVVAGLEEYQLECVESGEVPCIDVKHHAWVVSDENENVCYCEKCGCAEY